jgi:hypothetical protein
MNQMKFDHRLTAPVRMTAMAIRRNVEDGPKRVAPTSQPAAAVASPTPRTPVRLNIAWLTALAADDNGLMPRVTD